MRYLDKSYTFECPTCGARVGFCTKQGRTSLNLCECASWREVVVYLPGETIAIIAKPEMVKPRGASVRPVK